MTSTTVPGALAAIPPAPVLVSPIGSVPNPSPTYTWNASAGATQYTLQVYDSAGTRLLQRLYDASAVCVGSVCAKAETLVLALGSYTCKVKAQNAQGGTWSSSLGFNVIPPPPRRDSPGGGVQTATQPYYEDEAPLVTGYEYDALDRVVKVSLPGSGSILTSYTASSQTTTAPNSKTTTTRFDHFGRVKTVERPFKGQTATTTTYYDRLGRRDWMTDPVEAKWTWIYDSLGRVVDDRDPDRGRWLYKYDDAGRLLEQTDAKGQVTTLGYDVGRISTRQNTAGTTTYSYGQERQNSFNVGRLTTVTFVAPNEPDSILLYDYDELGRVLRQSSTVDGQTYTASKTWAPGGYLQLIGYEEGESVGPIGYDEAGRVTSVSGIVDTVTYDASGRPRQKTNANATTTTWTYAPTRGVLEGISTLMGSTPIQNLGYTIDDAGLVRVVTSNATGEGWQYDYDELNHMWKAFNPTSPGDTQTFDYDAGDRIKSNSRVVGTYDYPTTPTAPRPHAPSHVSGSLYTYDDNGNLEVGGGRALVWNADNLISQVDDQVGTTHFAYDGLGERVKKTNGSTTSLYPFGDDYEVTSGVTTKYISVEGLGVVAKKVTGGPSPGTFWIHTDRLGSIDAVTDLDGSIALQRFYRPYGETLSRPSSHTESRGWIDQRNDTETGLTYLHARYFDPKLGIFLSPDPIGVDGGMNQYGYGFGDPVNNADPSGLGPDGGPDIPWWWIIRGLWGIFGGGDDRPPCNPFTCRSGSAEDRHPQPGGGGTPADGGGHAVPRDPQTPAPPTPIVIGPPVIIKAPAPTPSPKPKVIVPNNVMGPLESGIHYEAEVRFTRCGAIPPAPPGADLYGNMREAASHLNPFWFYNQVRNKGVFGQSSG